MGFEPGGPQPSPNPPSPASVCEREREGDRQTDRGEREKERERIVATPRRLPICHCSAGDCTGSALLRSTELSLCTNLRRTGTNSERCVQVCVQVCVCVCVCACVCLNRFGCFPGSLLPVPALRWRRERQSQRQSHSTTQHHSHTTLIPLSQHISYTRT